MDKIKGAIKSKTVWFSTALMVLGLAESNLHFMQNLMSPEDYGVTVAVIGGITGILRALTSTGLEDK